MTLTYEDILDNHYDRLQKLLEKQITALAETALNLVVTELQADVKYIKNADSIAEDIGVEQADDAVEEVMSDLRDDNSMIDSASDLDDFISDYLVNNYDPDFMRDQVLSKIDADYFVEQAKEDILTNLVSNPEHSNVDRGFWSTVLNRAGLSLEQASFYAKAENTSLFIETFAPDVDE